MFQLHNLSSIRLLPPPEKVNHETRLLFLHPIARSYSSTEKGTDGRQGRMAYLYSHQMFLPLNKSLIQVQAARPGRRLAAVSVTSQEEPRAQVPGQVGPTSTEKVRHSRAYSVDSEFVRFQSNDNLLFETQSFIFSSPCNDSYRGRRGHPHVRLHPHRVLAQPTLLPEPQIGHPL